jgi:methylthioribulose-1-phosphate dehydratase
MRKSFVSRNSNKKQIICYLLREFYNLGWATGSGGGISIRENENSAWMAPSGVHKEFVEEDDLFLLDLNGEVITPPKTSNLKCSECTPLFLQAYNIRNAGAVLHSHSLNAVMITQLFGTEFQCIDFEMIKGIQGHKNTEWCIVPIIENTEYETELTESLKNAIVTYPRSHAVLVRNHGVYIWGPTWEKAKIHAECYEYLFKAVLKLHKFGLKVPKTNESERLLRAWYIDEEKAKTEDIRTDLQPKNVQWVTRRHLQDCKVVLERLSGNREDPLLFEIYEGRNYQNKDEKEVGPKIMSNYEEMRAIFATEHLHADEEIRYVLNGSGYFDVRDLSDRWIRIHVTKGDFLTLPEGIYHRFVPDVTNYIHVMRLYQKEPKWTPVNRPCDEHPSRLKYLGKSI